MAIIHCSCETITLPFHLEATCLMTYCIPQGDCNDGEVGGEGEHGEQSQEVVYHLQQQAILPASKKKFMYWVHIKKELISDLKCFL
jgi:hypothetical protein